MKALSTSDGFRLGLLYGIGADLAIIPEISPGRNAKHSKVHAVNLEVFTMWVIQALELFTSAFRLLW
jgi:hypothetical protein